MSEPMLCDDSPEPSLAMWRSVARLSKKMCRCPKAHIRISTAPTPTITPNTATAERCTPLPSDSPVHHAMSRGVKANTKPSTLGVRENAFIPSKQPPKSTGSGWRFSNCSIAKR